MNEFHFNQPRPPVVPGEETEGAVWARGPNNDDVRQTRQVNHQPAITPRSYNTAGQHSMQDGDAPLGFEPEGRSVSPQRCHNDNCPSEIECDKGVKLDSNCCGRKSNSPPSTPPSCLQWARDLHSLLADPDGVTLFRKYLVQEGHSDHLDFWFACQGLRKQTTDERIAQFLKVIYRHYFLKSQLGIEENLRKSVHKRMKECGRSLVKPDVTIFDEAQNQVECIIRETTYPNFLKSEVYLDHVRNVQAGKIEDADPAQQSPSECMNESGSGSGTVSPNNIVVSTSHSNNDFLASTGVPQATLLATVHEDKELDTTRYDNNLPNQLPMGLPIMHPLPQSSSFPPLTKDMLIMTQKRRAHDVRPRTETFAAGVFMHGSGKTRAYSSYNPVSRQDSELQSLSSDARTESDNMSLTDTSVDGAAVHHRMTRKQYQRHCRQVKESASLNRDPHMHHTVIPRTQRLNITQVNHMKPQDFAAILIEKLETVRREQDAQEKLAHRLFNAEPGGAPSAKTLADAIRERFQIVEDNDQDILDQHVSRVWSDQTPSRTPGIISPRPRSPPDHLRRKANKGTGATNLGACHGGNHLSAHQKQGVHNVSHPYQTKGSHSSRHAKKDKDVFSTFSSDSGNVHDFPEHKLHLPKSKSVPDYQDSTDTYSSLPSHDGRGRSGCRDWSSSGSSSRRHLKKPDQTDSGVSVVSDASIHGSNKDSRVLSWLIESDRNCAGCTMAERDSGSSCSGGSRLDSKHHVRPNMIRGRRSPPGPAQPFIADPNMPPLPLPHTLSQLDEARRRLEDQHRSVKQHSRCTSGMSTSFCSGGSKSEAALVGSNLAGSRKSTNSVSQEQKQSSYPTAVTPAASTISSHSSSAYTTVVFSFCDEQFPYRTKIPGHSVTLRQFKEFLPKKGNYRYFFKTECEELDMKVIQEEITDDNDVLPLWEGKVMAQVKPID